MSQLKQQQMQVTTFDQLVSLENQGLFECPICLATIVKPISLSCGHSFCEPCIKSKNFKYVKNVCPLCRISIPIQVNQIGVNLILDKILINRYGHQKNYQQRLIANKKVTYTKVIRLMDDIKKWLKQKLPWIIIMCLLYHLLKVKINAVSFSMKGYKQKALEIADSIKGEDSLDFKFLLFSQFMRVLFSNIVIP